MGMKKSHKSKAPYFDEHESKWHYIPEKTTVTDDWTVLVLDNGYKILTFGDTYCAGAQVHVLNPKGEETVMWDCKEWEDAPEEVMGAMLRAAAGE